MSLSGKSLLVVNAAKWRLKQRLDSDHKAKVAAVRALGGQIAANRSTEHRSELGKAVTAKYMVSPAWAAKGEVPVLWFDQGENYGDILSPWLIAQITGLPVRFAEPTETHLVAVGSIASEASSSSIVWGSGTYGTERRGAFNKKAEYTAVRGPITRSRLLNVGINCPRVYGDPALLTPLYYSPDVPKTHKVGIVVRHTESVWQSLDVGEGIKIIDLKTEDVEATTREILSCENIVSSSLHGLILADAYGVPNAWLESDSAKGGSRPFGGEFKFYDYFASVDKLRHAQELPETAQTLTAQHLLDSLEFDARPISFDPETLLDACPLLVKSNG
ncbi:polysaccharide pyruvyl transferase family protein [Nocardioides yefusunii]|uniref:Polysaccharide pyruvyl transferase family protein n=1 Tax=Nocardioides yefusunii TaxID=2500546 RepID=A0ABW1QWW6_9ACTN|nr:polysaccharide pyruvyl transferase family protein [Nocardioides yefusunii]